MFEFFARLFRGEPSGQTAKERLRLVLLSDHLALAPDVVEAMKTDLLAVISRYVEVDDANVDVRFEQREHEVAMLANIPIRSMKEREAVRPKKVAPVVAFPKDDTLAPFPKAETLAAAAVDAALGEVPAPAAAFDAPHAEAVPAAVKSPASKPRRRRRRKSASRAAVQSAPVQPPATQDAFGQSAQA